MPELPKSNRQATAPVGGAARDVILAALATYICGLVMIIPQSFRPTEAVCLPLIIGTLTFVRKVLKDRGII